jgi:uncharacterized protein with PQ loop repeat
MNVEIIGYTAVVIGALSTAPQIYQIVKTKKVRDINFLFFFLRAVSSILYILYGILKEDYVMFASAIMPLVLEFTVLVLYLLYTKNDDVVDNHV